MIPARPIDLVQQLRALADTRPGDRAIIAVRGDTDVVVTYAALDARTRALAARLQASFSVGDRALLVFDNDEHFATAFFACLYAGLIAVPVAPPESVRRQHVARLVGIAADAHASVVLTTASLQPLVEVLAASAPLLLVDPLGDDGADRWAQRTPSAGEVAFLQYTSGSTAAPKGVMVTHGNLMANSRAIGEGMSVTRDDVMVSWLPLHHDMGLIGGLLQPFHAGIPVVLMSPRHFLERPVRWLQAISRYRGTMSGGPDFAYRLCVERVTPQQLAGLDLSCWAVAFSGAEPVRPATLEAFAAHCAPAGFRPQALFPCYGLAEATLFVTGPGRGAGLATGRFDGNEPLAGCGASAFGHRVEIVDPQTQAPVAPGELGEVRVTGPSIARGYWQKHAETQATFVEDGGHTWLRTGDLGRVDGGHLFIAGRLKDLIIVRGHNLYPQDIERQVEAEVDAVRAGRVAAFAVAGPHGEGIGLAAEVSRSMQKLVRPEVLVEALGAAVGEHCGEPLSVVMLLNPGGMPKTTSGKLQRGACRELWRQRAPEAYAIFEHGAFVRGEGAAKGADALPADAREQALAHLWQDVLRGPLPHRATHFFTHGGNSLTATEVAARVAERWQIDFSVRALFEHPRLAACAAEVRRRLADPSPSPRSLLVPVPRGTSLPLSHAQQRQWFLWHLEPAGTAYHVAAQFTLTGPLDPAAWQRAFDAVVARHEALRTVFRAGPDGAGEQVVLPVARVPLAFTDLSDLTVAERDAQATAAAHRLNHTAFDLAEGPLVRAALLRCAAGVHRFVLVMHHIVADAVSMQVVLDELGAPGARPALPIQYADYAASHRAWLDGGVRARQLAYWKAQLGGDQPVLALPADLPRPAVARYTARTFAFALAPERVAGLRRLAEDQESTLFMVLLAALQAVMHRYTGQEDIRVGVPVANRHHAGLAGVVGFFVNTQVHRNHVTGRSRLADVLARTRLAALDAHANPDLPFEQLVEALQPERSLAHAPLFQVLFNHLHEDFRAFEAATGLAVQSEALDGQAAQFELTVEVRERAGGAVVVRLVHARELFEPATIAQLAGHFDTMLQAFEAQPQQAVGDVVLLSPAEQAVLSAWDTNTGATAPAGTVHALFEAQVARSPSAPAVVFGETGLTYAELDARANRLAHLLVDRGVSPETRVGVAMTRSIEMVVALLAVMKAGGAYVPIDPEHPADRIAYMLDDSAVPLLLTQRHLPRPVHRVAVVDVDALDLSTGPAHAPRVPMDGENLVYVIYTSGSTGRPKGAANRHRGLCNRLAWGQRHQPLDGTDTVLQKTPFGFDISFWEFFWPLTVGARLVLAAPGDHRDPARLVDLIEHHAVSTVHFVPSMLQAFVSHPGAGVCQRVRRIVCSGEALSAELQDRTLAMFPHATLLNLYGPTEASIEATFWDCRTDGASTVPIGRPIAGLQARVLDADFNAAPRGVAGELLLGGMGLARGYWNRPALTAERFVADPAGRAGERLYRTGDLVRWRADGQVEYLGRIDHQVKVRGFRIELGEVEAALLALPGVREAVVVAPDGTRLVAYVGADEGPGSEAAHLKAQLGLSLPDYMVPSVFVRLDRLPLNTNGKVDRKALPDPGATSAPAYVAPQGALAEGIAALWAEVLQRDRVGQTDNFFDLGGHSLLLIRVHGLLKERLGVVLPVVDLFQHPTVGALACHIGNGPAAAVPADRRAERQRDALRRRRLSTERTRA